ncbi:hypothetical protein Pelo_4244 [Pelomyxa schiedti]|nr:hypothetical protein Pelo_4244 [Pelomyxa schiedti]
MVVYAYSTPLLRAVLCVAAIAAISFAQEATDTTCDFECWLQTLIIHVPDTNFTTVIDGHNTTIYVWNAECSRVDYDAIDSSIKSMKTYTMDFQVRGITMECTTDYKFVDHDTGETFEGGFFVQVEPRDSVLYTIMNLTWDHYGMPGGLLINECDATIGISLNLTRGDDIPPRIWNIFVDMVDQTLEVATCELCTRLAAVVTDKLKWISHMCRNMTKPQSEPDFPPPKGNPADMTESAYVNLLAYYADQLLGADGEAGDINDVINGMTNDTGIFESAYKFNGTFSNDKMGDITIGVETIEMEINATDYELLTPVDKVTVDNWILVNLGSLNWTIWFNWTTGYNDIMYNPVPLFGDMFFGVVLHDTMWHFLMQMAMYPDIGDNYTNAMWFSSDCILEMFDENTTGITSMNASISYVTGGAVAGGWLGGDIKTFVDNFCTLTVDMYLVTAPQWIVGIITGPVLRELNDRIYNTLHNASCEYKSDDEVPTDANQAATYVSLAAAVAAGTFVLLGALAATFCTIRSRIGSVEAPKEEGEDASIKGGKGGAHQVALLFNPRLRFIRFFIPALILLNAVLFITSHTAAMSAVVFYITGGFTPDIEQPYCGFALPLTIHDAYKGDAGLLATLILIFSGILPYVRILLLIAVWCLPPRLLPVRARDWTLLVLDALGKWTLFLLFALVPFFVSMSVTLNYPVYDPEGNYVPNPVTVSSYSEALYGFLTLILAVIASLLISQLVLFLHRWAEYMGKEEEPDDREIHVTLFQRTIGSAGHQKIGCITVSALFGIAAIFLLVGLLGPVYQFTTKGILGGTIDTVGDKTHFHYSMATLTGAFPDATNDPSDFKMRLVQATFIFTAFCVPILHIILLTVMWVVPMSKLALRNLTWATEFANSWSLYEVFALATLVTVPSMNKLTTYISKDACDLLTPLLTGYMTDGETSCFRIVGKLGNCYWPAMIGAIIYFATTLVVRFSADMALHRPGDERPIIN